MRALARFRHYASAAFVVALLLVGLQVAMQPLRAPISDEFTYLMIADDIKATGNFTDGPFASGDNPKAPGRFVSPLYPSFLYALLSLDGQVADAISCYAKEREAGRHKCGGSMRTVVVVQTVIAALSLLFIFLAARLVSGSALVAWLAMLIAVATGEYAYYARHYLTENLAYFGFYGMLYFLVASYVHERPRDFLLAGLFAAVAILARPSYLYAFYFLVPLLFLALLTVRKSTPLNAAKLTGLFVVGGLVLMAPWMIRNLMLFGDPALSKGYGAFILKQRLAYNMMSWQEWGAFFILGLPDFGDIWAKALFPRELWERLLYDEAGIPTYFLIGNSSEWSAKLLPAGLPADAHVSYLIKNHIFGDLFKHIMVTFPIALRGMWAGGYLALAGVALAWPVGRMLARDKRLMPLILLALPLLFMVGLHGFVSVNVVRYNIPMIALYATICAVFIWRMLKLWQPGGRLVARFDVNVAGLK